MEEGILNFTNFTLVVSGNAYKSPDESIHCQHGPIECVLNKYLNCAMAKSKDVHQWLPFVSCVEEARYAFEYDNAAFIDCARKVWNAGV